MILSFAFTTPALLSGRKTVTRRDWSERHAAHFHSGQVVDAYDKSPRNGGRKVGEIRLAAFDQTRYPISAMPDSDYEAEGFAYLNERYTVPPRSAPFKDFSRGGFNRWRDSGVSLYVVRFELVSVVDGAAGPIAAFSTGVPR